MKNCWGKKVNLTLSLDQKGETLLKLSELVLKILVTFEFYLRIFFNLS